MKNILSALVLLFMGCSSETPPNMWQYKTHNSYQSFETYFLEYKLDLAAVSLKRAREYASQSADLTTLAQIELSVCALKVALLEPFSCPRFDTLEPLVNSDRLSAYKHFLDNSLTQDEISLLPDQYKDFAQSRHNQSTQQMLEEISQITPLTSKMIAASLVKEELSPSIRKKILDDISYHGYTYAAITWLTFEIEHTDDSTKKRALLQKLKIIYSLR